MCGYMEHFYHGEWDFYNGKLVCCVWLDFPEINLPCEISMDTSKRRKTPAMTFNMVNKKGDLIPQGKRADQESLLRWFSTDA